MCQFLVRFVNFIIIFLAFKSYLVCAGTQALITNRFFPPFRLERLYIYSCRYNYRSDHCMYMSVCKDANKNGVAVIHGSRSTFHGDKQPAFKAIYSSMEEVRLATQ